MSKSYRYVKLLKNHLYPTYQLHAYMANEKTTPQDGIRLAALTTIQWLKKRLGDAVPVQWDGLPTPDRYRTAKDDDLPSIYLNQGHVINIVSLLNKGMWTLQITEPDLGSDPGNPNQARLPVPGRIIETNIAYKIVGNRLECGFKTIISDPEGTRPEAEVYRISVVRLLMENPDFGLKQVFRINNEVLRLMNSKDIKTMLWLVHHEDNQLPAVIFTKPVEKRKTRAQDLNLGSSSLGKVYLRHQIQVSEHLLANTPLKIPATDRFELIPRELPYDMEKFTYYTFSHCWTYVLDYKVNAQFTTLCGIKFKPGDIIVIYPTSLGRGERVIPFTKPASPWDENIQAIEKGVKDYLKGCSVDFGNILFLSGVREQLLQTTQELTEEAKVSGAQFEEKIERLNAYWRSEIEKKEKDLEDVRDKLGRQKKVASQLEEEKTRLRERFSQELEALQQQIDKYKEVNAFLRRKCDRPQKYDGIQAWAERYFSDHLLLHPKAIDRMMTRTNQCASVDLICDALEYLATEYWEIRYHHLAQEVALTRCTEKYNRPFEVKPTGQATIEFTPGEYKIKYFKDARGNECESDLDYHLRVGNNPENLLRIYFLHDDAEKRIVVGSLPDHLRAVSIQ